MGILGSVFGISAIGGPLVGAALIPYGWNWCFTINIQANEAVEYIHKKNKIAKGFFF